MARSTAAPDPTSAPRATSLERLREGALDVVFAVDMFNEGIDLPNVDAVLMLRPTESRLLWLQQFGRGLRRAAGKAHLTVVDYIGNHRVFLNKPRALLGIGGGDRELAQALERLATGTFALPPGCEVTYDLAAVDVLRALLRVPKHEEAQALRDWYREFRERTGERPRAVEALHEGYDPRSARKRFGSWVGLVREEGDFAPEVARLFEDGAPAAELLGHLETTPMSRSFKMLVVLAMVNADRFPGEIEVDALAGGFARLAGRTARLRADVGVALGDRRALRAYLEQNPIDAWAGGAGTGGTAYFAYEHGRFRTTFDVPAGTRAAFQELAWELAEWRLAEYLARTPEAPAGTSGDAAPLGDREPAVTADERGLTLWRSYPREEIPARLGLSISGRMLQSGVVSAGEHLLLFVTLEKASMPAAHRYQDRFLSADTFQWQSQNRTPQEGSIGRTLRDSARHGKRIHLFIRRAAKMGGATAPFVYCGEPTFVDWEGERPITVRWRLPERVPEYLWERLGVPGEGA